MATQQNDLLVVQRGTVSGAGGDDTFILSGANVEANAQITITDTLGVNTLQLIGGLSIVSSIVMNNTAQLTLSNGAVVTIMSASNFTYEIGGNPLLGQPGIDQTYEQFVTTTLGTTVPATGQNTGGSVIIPADTTSPTLVAGAASVNEGQTATFALAHASANTTYTYNITGVEAADVTGGLLTGTVTTDANGAATISVATVADRLTEGAQTITVSLPNSAMTASTTLNDTSLDNIAPVATAATLAAAEDGAVLSGQLVATDADGDAIAFELTAPVEGLTVNADGTYTFNPLLNTAAQALKYDSAPLVITANYTATDNAPVPGSTSSTLTITVTPKPLSYSLVGSAAFVEEGSTVKYTLVASEAVATAVSGTIQVVAGDGTTGQTAANDFGSGSLNPVTVTIAAGDTVSTAMTLTPTNDSVTESPEAYSVKGTITGQTIANVAGEVRDPSTVGGLGQTFTLTTGVDTIPGLIGSAGSTGTDGSDTIVALLGTGATLGGLDQINGGLGTNSMTLNVDGGVTTFPGTAAISNIQTMTLRGTANLGTVGLNDLLKDGADNADAIPTSAFDVSGVTGLTTMNVTIGTSASIKAAATTDVNVSGITGGIEVNGGKIVTITDATADTNITVGSTVAAAADNTNTVGTAAAGAINVTDTNQGTGVIQVDGGTNVTVTTTSTKDNGATAVGALKAASGTVGVTANLTGDGTATIDQGDVTVTGGTAVTVASNLTITAKDSAAGNAHTFGDVTVTSDNKTTSVTVSQTYAETEFTKAAVAVVKELHTVTFKALALGETTTVDGLTFTAGKALTATEVAQAFSNLTASDTQTSGGKTANGFYSGALSANFTSGSATGAVVVFTAKDESETLALTAGVIDPTETTVAGTVASGAVTSSNTVTYGAVRVDDNATASITTLTVNGYGSADLGDTTGNDLNALTTLSLANSGGIATVDTSATALGLTVNNVNHTVNLSGAASLKTLNVTATGANSTFGLSAAAVETLTVAGSKVLDIDTGSTLTALKTVTVSGSAGLSIAAGALANVTAITTTDTTGAVAATIDGSKATYTGGAGADTVTLAATTVAKNITLGGGDDTVDGTLATLTGTFTFDGGTDTNTLALSAAQAETLSADTAFEGKITAFQRLTIGNAASQEVVDLANLDDISYVKLGTSAAGAAQVVTLTDAAAKNAGPTKYEVGDIVTVTVNGLTVNYTLIAADIAADDSVMNTAIAAAINADAAIGSLVNAVATDASVITLTSDVAGLSFTASMAITDKVAGTAGVDTITSATTTANTPGITLNNMASGGTVVLTGAGTATVGVTDASVDGHTTDVLNVTVENIGGAGNTAAGYLSVANVETVNIIVNDGDNDTGIDDHSLTLVADKVTAITIANPSDIVQVAGKNQLDLTTFNLTVTGATALATVNASAMLGSFTHTASVASVVVTGGSGADNLSAAANDVKLYGGAGADTLTVNSGLRVNLYGEAGADTFVIASGTASNSLDAYTVINGVESGDIIKFGDGATFSATKIALSEGADETLLNYANQATKLLAENGMGWFQKGGNTYIVLDQTAGAANAGGAADSFDTGTDQIIMLTGVVTLSDASYNSSNNTLEIA